MSNRIHKINLLPVPSREETRHLIDGLLGNLGKAVQIMDEYGEQYDHETPWRQAYVADAKFYLYRVRIGAIGRINTCRDAVTLGICSKTRALSHHFTSVGLYYMFRYARQEQKKYSYLKKLNTWLNNYLQDRNGKSANSRFMVYNHL
jgi:hypothetical protein